MCVRERMREREERQLRTKRERGECDNAKIGVQK